MHWAPAARIGFVALAAGTAGTVLVTVSAIPLWVTFLTCALSGFGIGVVFNTTSVSAMGQATPGQEGLVGSQLGVADALGFATIGAIGGALVGGRPACSTWPRRWPWCSCWRRPSPSSVLRSRLGCAPRRRLRVARRPPTLLAARPLASAGAGPGWQAVRPCRDRCRA